MSFHLFRDPVSLYVSNAGTSSRLSFTKDNKQPGPQIENVSVQEVKRRENADEKIKNLRERAVARLAGIGFALSVETAATEKGTV